MIDYFFLLALVTAFIPYVTVFIPLPSVIALSSYRNRYCRGVAIAWSTAWALLGLMWTAELVQGLPQDVADFVGDPWVLWALLAWFCAPPAIRLTQHTLRVTKGRQTRAREDEDHATS